MTWYSQVWNNYSYLFYTGPCRPQHPPPAPKVVLLDLKLPKIDGLEVLRTLKNDDRSSSLTVVVLISSR